jgi:hypothetical protein
MHYPIIHLLGSDTRRYSVWGFYVSYVLVHFKYLFIRTESARTLNDTSGGYHLGALNFRSDHSPFFPFSILYFLLIASLGL